MNENNIFPKVVIYQFEGDILSVAIAYNQADLDRLTDKNSGGLVSVNVFNVDEE